jgi:hypothetical protein
VTLARCPEDAGGRPPDRGPLALLDGVRLTPGQRVPDQQVAVAQRQPDRRLQFAVALAGR